MADVGLESFLGVLDVLLQLTDVGGNRSSFVKTLSQSDEVEMERSFFWLHVLYRFHLSSILEHQFGWILGVEVDLIINVSNSNGFWYGFGVNFLFDFLLDFLFNFLFIYNLLGILLFELNSFDTACAWEQKQSC